MSRLHRNRFPSNAEWQQTDCGNDWIVEILVAGTGKKSYTCGSDFTDSQRGQEGLQ